MEARVKTSSKILKARIEDKNPKIRFDHRAYARMKQQESVLENSVDHFLNNSKICPDIGQSMQKELTAMKSERLKLQKQLMFIVTDVFEELKSAKLVMNDLQKDEQVVDVQSYKVKLHSIWTKIQDFKRNQYSLETLTEQQKSLDLELNEYTNLFKKCENDKDTVNPVMSSGKISSSLTRENLDYENVENFCSLIARTGHTNGWSQEDHSFFMKLRKRHKNIPALVAAIRSKCPDLTAECIVNHEAWYKTYLALQEKQRTTVKEWRSQKDLERITKIVRNRKILEQDMEGKEGDNEQSKMKRELKSSVKLEMKEMIAKHESKGLNEEEIRIFKPKTCTSSTVKTHPYRTRISTVMKPTKVWEAKVKSRECTEKPQCKL